MSKPILEDKLCPDCKETKSLVEFYVERRRKDGSILYRRNCKACVIVSTMKRDAKTPDIKRSRGREYARRLRWEALMAYSENEHPECTCCQEDMLEFLTIDHVDNNGAKHRKEVIKTQTFYNWLKSNNWPSGFQILCFNCNLAKGHYGICPHQELSWLSSARENRPRVWKRKEAVMENV